MSSSTSETYSERLTRVQTARWKRLLDVQRPYRIHLRRLRPGRVLDIGCGIGRNLLHLEGNGVGIDYDPAMVDYVRSVRHLDAYTPEEFARSPHGSGRGFDSLLIAHVLEHMDEPRGVDLIAEYLPRIRSGGRVIIMTPQERGFASDATHVRFVDFEAAAQLAERAGLRVARQYSFPFPRAAGRFFLYNEFVTLLQVPSAVQET